MLAVSEHLAGYFTQTHWVREGFQEEVMAKLWPEHMIPLVKRQSLNDSSSPKAKTTASDARVRLLYPMSTSVLTINFHIKLGLLYM